MAASAQPAPGEIVRSTPLARYRLADNPGPMSLDGTKSYIIAAVEGGSTVVVDPGPADELHLSALAASGDVELVLITHRHPDHTAGAQRFHELTGAPVRAADPAFCFGGEPLRDGEAIQAGGTRIEVLATPGHTSDSVCFFLPEDGTNGSVLTGDTILGRGTTVLDYPDGTLQDFMASLEKLGTLGPAAVLPAHGADLENLESVVLTYRDHRDERLAQIRAALEDLGADASVQEVTDAVYADVPAAVRGAAELSVAAQLEYLRVAG
ncbi:MBL fold metallo-hydrolase [Arthrobacter caoxuetaonis]|uniref:MBL fold metallo-hydrolase n=1 Tax=Arthrobacter caoxuetaonis TaxID=2886935 RepID=UPI001D137225|nr:MBL fold metallo-hydrolase [Arthrobacter caoxuetaonis]MCC3280774.1 MBL fold metallo-hydrolase [Arthrobacter caoxuetaonis]